MRIVIERRRTPPRAELVEVVTPRVNGATVSAAENLFAALASGQSGGPAEPFALEIAATHEARWLLARAGSPTMLHHVEEQLTVAYPQAGLRPLDLAQYPGLDPARMREGEQAAGCVLALSGPAYLPLHTFRDQEVAAETRADPVLGLLGALGDLPAGWRALTQLVCLRPAPENWSRDYVRLTVEHPLAAERGGGRDGTSLTSVFLMGGLLLAGAVFFQGYQWYDAGDWLPLGLLAGSGVTGVPALCWLARRLGHHPMYDPRLVQEKLSRSAYVTELRLAVFAPADAPPVEVQGRVFRLAGAYRQFTLPAGNGLLARPLKFQGDEFRRLEPVGTKKTAMVLNARELAGLWHLPQGAADVPFLERTTARRHLPLPAAVAHGCVIGVSARQGRSVPVALDPDLLRRHLLLVAKTRRGKSSLLLQLARYLVDANGGPAAPRQSVMLVDPHGDLAQAAVGLMPASRHQDVVYLDLAQHERPFGLNLLDTGLGWDRDQAVANALAIFRREFDRFWGPRMEDAFRFALLTLVEANQALCAAGPDGRGRQHTILEVPAVLANPGFRRQTLTLVTDPVVKQWWSGYFDTLDRRLQMEIINPVQTKVQRFAGSRAARAVVSQPCSTVDPASWLRAGAVVIVNGAKGIVGEDTTALIGGTLLNLMALAVAQQATLPPAQRRWVSLLVDEFHSLPGADYELMLAELSKYGANLVLATQSLARLEALDRQHQRALRATVFANLDGLFVFNTSAEDARYLVRELGDEVDEQDLVALGDYQCYARMSAGSERLHVFSIQLNAPPASDPTVGQRLAFASAARYGQAKELVETELATKLATIEQFRQTHAGHHSAASLVNAETAGAIHPPDGRSERGEPTHPGDSRSEHRPRRQKRSPAQGQFFSQGDLGAELGMIPLPGADVTEPAAQMTGEDVTGT